MLNVLRVYFHFLRVYFHFLRAYFHFLRVYFHFLRAYFYFLRAYFHFLRAYFYFLRAYFHFLRAYFYFLRAYFHFFRCTQLFCICCLIIYPCESGNPLKNSIWRLKENRYFYVVVLQDPLHSGVAEWSNAAVLKTVVLRSTGGSNPSASAKNTNNINYRI